MIVERSQEQRLALRRVAITSTYMADGKKYIRSTDHSRNDNVQSAVLVEKIYYVGGTPLKRITGFDPRMQYTYLSASPEQKEVHCPNCGYPGSSREMADGCPACGAAFNVEYSDKELGAKYHYDQVVSGKGYKIRTLLIDVFVSFFLSFFVFRFTGRTFNIYDIGKVIIGTTILTLALYFVFFQLDAYLVSGAARREAEKRNQKQRAFWEMAGQRGIGKKVFFNNLLYELRNLYYGGEPSFADVIDFDVVDFLDFELQDGSSGNGEIRVRVHLLIREIRLDGGQITEKKENRTFVLERKQAPVRILAPGMNVIKCQNCGASVDVTASFCTYCGTAMQRYQEWSLVKRQG